jgi:microcystin-dependent protein
MATIVTINASDQITNSRADLNTNFANLNTDKIETSVLDTDTALTANSDSKVATQKAVKAYADSLGGQTYLVPTGAILPYGGSTAPTNFLLCDGTAVSRTTYATLFGILSTNYGVGNGTTTFNLPNMQGRVPVGYSASAPTKTFTFASRSGNVITITGVDNHAHNELQTGQAIFYDTTSGVITGLTDATTYYVVRVTATTFSLATTVANANAGTVIALSSDGSGTQTFVITYTARPLGQTGGEETHALTDAQLPSHNHPSIDSTGGAGSEYDAGAVTTRATANGYSDTGANAIIGPTGSDTPHNIMPLFTVMNYIIKT